MQQLRYICTGTSRLFRVVGGNYLENSKLLFEKENSLYNTNNLILKRCLSSKNNNSKTTNDIDTHAELYKPSTDKQKTHVTSSLKGGQPIDTIGTAPQTSTTGSGKVWSAQNPDGIHVAPLGRISATTFVPSSKADDTKVHEPTIYTTHKGAVNFADPIGTHVLKPETSPAQLAEAAAASAFEPFAPDTSSKPTSSTEAVFAPKISSTDTYSSTSSPTSNFDTAVPSQQETIKYEASHKPKVFGGQDTSADSKNHPKRNPFNLQEKIIPSSDSNRLSIQRDNILRESLNHVHQKGWSMEAIHAGITVCNQPITAKGLFYNSYDLIEYFMRDANANMVIYMNQLANTEDIQGTGLLIDGLKYRLKLVIPYAVIWEQALAQKGLPSNAKRAWKSLLDLANDAWLSIDDTSTGIKWYTKRISVATIYRSAEIYMLQDQSSDKTETMNFLERNLGDFVTITSVRPSVSQSLSDTAQIASGLLTVVRTMTTHR